MDLVGRSLAVRWYLNALPEEGVDAAFGLVEARPTPGSLVLALANRSSAWPAADRAVAAVLQRVVGNLVLLDIVPDGFAGPIRHRVQLQDVLIAQDIEVIEFEDLRLAARLALLATQAGNP